MKPTRATKRGPWAALLVLCLANFLILLDTSVVNTAAPAMMASLGADIDDILWVLNGYLIALSSLLIFFGRLGDLLGPRTVFVAGLAAFTTASVLCGLSSSIGMLIASRVLQGIGAAALLPQALTLISLLFPPDRRGAAFGIFTAVAGVAAVSGPTLGGLVVTELGWQWIFLFNLPIGFAGIMLGSYLVPHLDPKRPKAFDLVGVILATFGLGGIVYSIIESRPWAAVIAIPMILLFVLWELRHPEPLIPLTLFRNRNFSVGTVITLITSFSLYGFLLVFVIETQTLLGMSPLASGLAALPWTLTLSAVAPAAGRLTDRIGGRVLLTAGLGIYALGVVGMIAARAEFVVPLILIGIGMGAAIAPTTTEAMRHITPAQAGAASGVLNTARQVGAAIGAAVIGVVLQRGFPTIGPALGIAPQQGFPAIDPALEVVVAVLLVGSALAFLLVQTRHGHDRPTTTAAGPSAQSGPSGPSAQKPAGRARRTDNAERTERVGRA